MHSVSARHLFAAIAMLLTSNLWAAQNLARERNLPLEQSDRFHFVQRAGQHGHLSAQHE